MSNNGLYKEIMSKQVKSEDSRSLDRPYMFVFSFASRIDDFEVYRLIVQEVYKKFLCGESDDK